MRILVRPTHPVLQFLLVLGAAWPALALTGPTPAADRAGEPDPGPMLRVVEIVMAGSYDPVGKAPVDTASTFAPDVGRVVCFTRVTGAGTPVKITHVWFHEGKTKAKVELPVGSLDWRTYSSKGILPAWTGRWEVKVLDGNGAVLAAIDFSVEAGPAAPERP